MDPHILFLDTSFMYPGRTRTREWVLQRFNLAIGKGEFHVLLGPSGCGKTTVLNLAAGFEHPSLGEVRVSGRRVTAPGVDRVVIFQSSDSLYPWLTALQNAEFGLRIAGMPGSERTRRALNFLRLVGLAGQEHKFPCQLSGGMKQRVQLARALAGNADTLLMDEPFGALDAQTRSLLQTELVQLWQQTRYTTLFVTHDISEAILLADRVSVMTSGPGATLKETIDVPLGRPRSVAQPEFGDIYVRLNRLLGKEAA